MAYNANIHQRRSIRLKGYDYGQEGAYFVTLCTKNRAHLFGEVEGGEMKLNQFGMIASQEWAKTPEVRMNVVLDVFIIMPNHLHGILFITESKTEARHDDVTPFLSPSQTVGAIVRGYKSAVTKQINALLPEAEKMTVWQRNYHEHIIRNARAHQYISAYISNNPTRWKADRFFS
ncbi:transposase [Rufibacter psychrotolerans]|uniref:transposase n=1 Tax=Rufibacter psychrotolerans TaxID=2812556 RepID=UPI0019688385|nr:transposase [Rufibacter sp. SYSU D00308]